MRFKRHVHAFILEVLVSSVSLRRTGAKSPYSDILAQLHDCSCLGLLQGRYVQDNCPYIMQDPSILFYSLSPRLCGFFSYPWHLVFSRFREATIFSRDEYLLSPEMFCFDWIESSCRSNNDLMRTSFHPRPSTQSPGKKRAQQIQTLGKPVFSSTGTSTGMP